MIDRSDVKEQQRLAEAVGRGMLANDAAVASLGIELVRLATGAAAMRMTVRDDMLNGFATCHGGLITTLADSAFAYACNSRNVMTVAAGLSVDFLAPARVGDRLTAEAIEVSLRGRTGVYDVTVHNQRGEPIAVFRGRSHAIDGRETVPMAAPASASGPAPEWASASVPSTTTASTTGSTPGSTIASVPASVPPSRPAPMAPPVAGPAA